MSTAPQKLMTVDEFLAWAEGREGRWELIDGRPIATDNSKGIGFPSEASGAIVWIMSTCGPRLRPDAIEIPQSLIVVEVNGAKLAGYFSLPSVAHYLILDPERRTVIHHKRGEGDVIETRILTTGPLHLDPPGLELSLDELFRLAETPFPPGPTEDGFRA
jgi:Uma2 family endonuclease